MGGQFFQRLVTGYAQTATPLNPAEVISLPAAPAVEHVLQDPELSSAECFLSFH